jgi:transcriptional regulator with XRE-family HTH domain
MDPVRFGLAIRALRRRRGWTQAQLGDRCGLSQSTISRIESGEGDRLTLLVLGAAASALGARIRVTVQAHGEDLDRLLDSHHARLVDWAAVLLRGLGWIVVPEATFSVYGERGSIDLLAFHPPTGSLLAIEVKSVVPDVQATLAGIDRKARLAPTIAAARGWRVTSVSRWLIVPDDRTARRRVDAHGTSIRAALPGTTVEMRRWAKAPNGAVAGILFVSGMRQAGARHRIGARRGESGDTHARGGQVAPKP